jgi:hypothetical protein
MAIARGAGTEIIRTIQLEEVDSTGSVLIFGEQYHIYTVLSVICFTNSVATAGNYIRMRILGYDAKEGTTDVMHYIFQNDMNQYDTFVWNDKFSFNGHEPTNFTGPMDDATKQDAIADQGSGVAQKLEINSEAATDNFSVICTYIDQNNA